jgi:monofunctional biosynthetic peptidoglycan transglycosylase
LGFDGLTFPTSRHASVSRSSDASASAPTPPRDTGRFVKKKKPAPARPAKKRRLVWRILGYIAAACIAFYAICVISLVMFRVVDPPTTGVQIERRIGALVHGAKYTKKQKSLRLRSVSPDLQHAVIAAEDGRFYQHSGIDWEEVKKVAEESAETGEVSRGASTLTQQLVKNLFFTTHRNPVRKLFEYALTPVADRVLGKERVLEIYLNVVEWGPGVYGAEAAAQYHYGTSAARLSRDQAARLAAILPSPLRRRPARMNQYSAAILSRMQQMGW